MGGVEMGRPRGLVGSGRQGVGKAGECGPGCLKGALQLCSAGHLLD